jgi:hypothetical protein
VDTIKLMYKVMVTLTKYNVPLVFKGSLVLRQLMSNQTDINTIHMTI